MEIFLNLFVQNLRYLFILFYWKITSFYNISSPLFLFQRFPVSPRNLNVVDKAPCLFRHTMRQSKSYHAMPISREHLNLSTKAPGHMPNHSSLWLLAFPSILSAPIVGSTTLPGTLMQTLGQILCCLAPLHLGLPSKHFSLLYYFAHSSFSSSSIQYFLFTYKVYYLLSVVSK